ncbi:hypothetical protein SRIMM317S_00629 [Streptomyces rimosus subsp. rimosus]
MRRKLSGNLRSFYTLLFITKCQPCDHLTSSGRGAGDGLLRHRDFRLLLAGAAASQAGTQVALVALPLVAVVGLRASAFEVGLLTAARPPRSCSSACRRAPGWTGSGGCRC